MSPLVHSLATLWRRFRTELIAFAVLVLLGCAATLAGAGPRALVTLAGLETLMLFWLTLRILLAEDGFKTCGGWRTRPIAPFGMAGAQALLLAVVVIPPLVLHGIVIERLFQPAPDQWHTFLRGGLFKSATQWLAFVIGLKLFSAFILRPLDGIARKAAWSALVVALIPTLIFSLPNGGLQHQRGGWGGSGEAPGKLAQSIQHQLPDATELIGEWNDSLPDEVPQARLLVAIPLNAPRQAVGPGLLLESATARDEAGRVDIDLALQGLDTRIIGQIRSDPVAILRFSNGMYGTCLRHMVRLGSSATPFLATHDFRFQGTFVSPLCLPENQGTDPGKFVPEKVLFFVQDSDRPWLRSALDHQRADPGPPSPPLAIPSPSDGPAFALAVRQLIDSFSSDQGTEPSAVAIANKLPPEAIGPMLAYHPWADPAWTRLIRPFLLMHAGESHRPILLERLALDPRLASVFIEKGWPSEALPVLRSRAIEGLSLDAAALALLAEQNDPELADDLADLAMRLRSGIDKLAPVLRQSAGFDWPAFVAAGWKQRKYGNYDAEGWNYARWAAELGDPSALRRLAEEAAAGKKWEREQLAKLVAGEPVDLIGYLRENIGRLRYDTTTRKWTP